MAAKSVEWAMLRLVKAARDAAAADDDAVSQSIC